MDYQCCIVSLNVPKASTLLTTTQAADMPSKVTLNMKKVPQYMQPFLFINQLWIFMEQELSLWLGTKRRMNNALASAANPEGLWSTPYPLGTHSKKSFRIHRAYRPPLMQNIRNLLTKEDWRWNSQACHVSNWECILNDSCCCCSRIHEAANQLSRPYSGIRIIMPSSPPLSKESISSPLELSEKTEDTNISPTPASDIPNGGLNAYLQVFGAHILFFNSWWVLPSYRLHGVLIFVAGAY